MKYARKSAATTSTGTTIEVTKTTAAFVDRLVVSLHLLLSESYLKYIRHHKVRRSQKQKQIHSKMHRHIKKAIF